MNGPNDPLVCTVKYDGIRCDGPCPVCTRAKEERAHVDFDAPYPDCGGF